MIRVFEHDKRPGRPRRRGLAAEEGLTLIEAVFALSILAIGLLSLFALHQAAITASQLSFRISEATFLAQDMIEQLSNTQYTRGFTNPELDDAAMDQTDYNNPLIDLEHNFDGATDAKVNCLGGSDAGGGIPIYERTYDIETIADDAYGRFIVRARVTFAMGETAGNLHGVTLIQTRSFDRYE